MYTFHRMTAGRLTSRGYHVSSMQEGSSNGKTIYTPILHSPSLIDRVQRELPAIRILSVDYHRPHDHYRSIPGYAGYLFWPRWLLNAEPFAGKWWPKQSSCSLLPLVHSHWFSPPGHPPQPFGPQMWPSCHNEANTTDPNGSRCRPPFRLPYLSFRSPWQHRAPSNSNLLLMAKT